MLPRHPGRSYTNRPIGSTYYHVSSAYLQPSNLHTAITF